MKGERVKSRDLRSALISAFCIVSLKVPEPLVELLKLITLAETGLVVKCYDIESL